MPPSSEQQNPLQSPVPATSLQTPPSALIKFVRIFLLVLIVIGLGLIASYKVWVPKLVDAIVHPSQISSTQDIVSPNPTLEASVNFDANTVKIGDSVGNFQVLSIGPLHPEVGGLGNDNLKIVFSGTTTVKGTYGVGELFGAEIGAFSPQDVGLFPHNTSDDFDSIKMNPQYFSVCVDNPENIGSDIHSGDRLSITLGQYIYERYPSSGCPYHIVIESVSKIQP